MKRITCAVFTVLACLFVTPAPAAYDHHGYSRSGIEQSSVNIKKKSVKRYAKSPRYYARHRSGESLASRNRGVHRSYAVAAVKTSLTTQSTLVIVARSWLGKNPTGERSLWCADFMNYVLRQSGYSETRSRLARSFEKYGRKIAEPVIGAIAILPRGRGGWKGHVAVIAGIMKDGTLILVGGNQGSRGVNEIKYSARRVIAYVLPA